MLLQLFPFSSPHRERPEFVLLGPPACVGAACLSILCGIGKWVQLDPVKGCQISKTVEARSGSIPFVTQTKNFEGKRALKESSGFLLHGAEL